MAKLESLQLIVGGEGAGEYSEADDLELGYAGDIRAAIDSGDDQALADALKQFIKACLEEY